MLTGKRILLVIEDQNLDRILTYLLKAWGYEVIPCPDGRQALEIANRKYPDLILIDAHLSTAPSLALCRSLKDDFITAYIPIIILIDKRQLRRDLLDIEEGIDDFLVKPPDPIDLEIRIALALRSANHHFHANALTKLPGNRTIEKLVRSYIETGRTFSLGYLDINNFKSFNDKYGYVAGDHVILQTARIIVSAIKRCGHPRDFVGHIGGDDFVYLTTPDKEEVIAQECIDAFDRLSPLHYSPEDRKNRSLKARDRHGRVCEIPLMGLSIAIVNNASFKAHSIHQLIETTFEIKNFLKKRASSNYLINRRVCDAGRPQRARLEEAYDNELNRRQTHLRAKSFKPLGQIMLETHLITERQLEEALQRHWETGQRLGEAAVSLGFTNEENIRRLVEHQVFFVSADTAHH